MPTEKSPGPPEQSSMKDTPSVSPSVAEFTRRNSNRLADPLKSTLELSSVNSRVWVPDTSGKYVTHRSRTGLSEDENIRLSKTSLDYDPYKNRDYQSSVGNCFALIHLLKGYIGSGIWGTPLGFRIAGLLTGTIATFIMAPVVSYNFNLLMKTEYLLCKRKRVPYLAYGDAMLYAMEEGPDWMIQYSKTFKMFTNGAIVLHQIGAMCLYMNGVSKLLKGLIDEFHCDVLSLQAMITALGILFLLTLCVPTMHKFNYFSAVAMTLTLFCCSIVSYQVFTEVRVPEGELSLIGTPKMWNQFVDVMMIAMVSPGIVVSVERHMAHPQDFLGVCGIVNLSVVIEALLYWYIGFFGYYVYSEETKDHIFYNLPEYELLTRTVYIFHAISLLISFGLQAIPAFDVLWNDYMLPRMTYTSTKRIHIYNYTMRAVLYLISYVLTMTVGHYISFIQSFLVVVNVGVLGFGCPAIMQICYLWPDNFGKLNWIYYKDLAMCFFGVAIMACGFYNAVDAALHFKAAPASTCSLMSQSANDTS